MTCPPHPFGNVWDIFVVKMGDGVLLLSNEYRPEVLLSTLRCAGQSSKAKTNLSKMFIVLRSRNPPALTDHVILWFTKNCTLFSHSLEYFSTICSPLPSIFYPSSRIRLKCHLLHEIFPWASKSCTELPPSLCSHRKLLVPVFCSLMLRLVVYIFPSALNVPQRQVSHLIVTYMWN